MTPSGSSRAAATSATLPLLTLTILVSTVLLGCLSPGVSASAAAKDALKKGTAPSDSTTGGGRATDAAAAAAAAAAATTPVAWPEGMTGLWTGDYLPGSRLADGMNAMVFITPDVAENLVFVFADGDPDAIKTVMLSENIGIEPREDSPSRASGAGSFVWLNRAVATTDDALGGDLLPATADPAAAATADPAAAATADPTAATANPAAAATTVEPAAPGSTATRCISVTLEGDVMYVLGKDVDDAAADAGSFEGCPEAPVAADFQKSDDGAAPVFDLAAAKADFGIMFKRSHATEMDETVKWPAQFPGLWKGKILGSSSGSSAIGNDASPSKAVPIIGAVVQGSAINAWVYPDPEDAARIVSANIARANTSPAAAAAKTTPDDASFSFVNHPFKYTPGDEHPAGRERWFNRGIIDKDDKDEYTLYALANPAPGVTDAPPAEAPVEFPKTPVPAAVAAALDADDSAALADTGAEVAVVMTKV